MFDLVLSCLVLSYLAVVAVSPLEVGGQTALVFYTNRQSTCSATRARTRAFSSAIPSNVISLLLAMVDSNNSIVSQ